MATYYISAAGPKTAPQPACQWLGAGRAAPLPARLDRRRRGRSHRLPVLPRHPRTAINATCTAVCLEVLHVPYWLPLALFCGVASQFVPTLGTYIGGALPVLFAWGDRMASGTASAVLAFIMRLPADREPDLSRRRSRSAPWTSTHAVAFLAVLAIGALFGALGAFLALPVTATIQAIFTRLHQALRAGRVPADERSGAGEEVQGRGGRRGDQRARAQADERPYAARRQGSSARVPISDELRALRDQIYDLDEANETEDSETIAIPKDVLSRSVREGAKSGSAVKLRGVGDGTAQAHDDDGSSDGSAEPGAAKTSSDRPSDSESSGTAAKAGSRPSRKGPPAHAVATRPTDNPRSRWR